MFQNAMRFRSFILGVGLAIFIASASAGLSGHYIKAAHLYAPNGEIGSFEGVVNQELGGILFNGWYSASITSNQITIDWITGVTLQGLFGFNGFVLTVLDGSPITAVSIAPTSTWLAFTEDRLAFDGNHVWADFRSLSSLPTQRLELLITTAVPEVPAAVLMSTGLVFVALRMSRGRRFGTSLLQKLYIVASQAFRAL